jgi:hypothetical protein
MLAVLLLLELSLAVLACLPIGAQLGRKPLTSAFN